MEISEEIREGVSSSSICATTLEAMSNGDGRSNGCSLLVGTPPTSTTIIKEEDSSEFVSGNEDELGKGNGICFGENKLFTERNGWALELC